MAKSVGKCRMCGAKFNPCNGLKGLSPENQLFNWRRICCSLACATDYFKAIQESREREKKMSKTQTEQ